MPLDFSDLGIKTKNAKRYATTCPECSHNRKKQSAPCLTVNDEPNNRWYKCWNCGFSGNLDVQDKYEAVREKAKMPNLRKAFTQKAKAYIKTWGISEKTLKHFEIYEGVIFGKLQLNFPFFMHHTLVNVKHLNAEWKKGDNYSKWYQLSLKEGEERKILPFGINKIKTHDEDGVKIPNLRLLITEGEKDCVTFFECEYENVISVPQGAPSLNAKDFKKEFAWLNDPYVKTILDEVEYFYLAVDADEPGKKLCHHLSEILGKEKCRIIQYPTGYKDINEVFMGDEKKGLKALGKDGVDECYKNIKSIAIKGIIRIHEVYDKILEIRKNGFVPGFGVGDKDVDYLFTMKRKLLMVITGVPGAGKSVWARWWIVKMIIHNVDLDLKWAMFTPENRPVEREYAKILEVFTGQLLKEDSHNSMSDDVLRKASRWIHKHIMIIAPDKYNHESFGGTVNNDNHNTLDSIHKYVIYLKKTENIFGYMIDAWNKIEHEQPKNQTETQFISKQLDKVLSFGDYWDVATIIIAHPTKIEMVGENFKMPSLYSIKGSSAWKEKTDIGVIIHRYKMKKLSAKEAMEKGIDLASCDDDEKWEVMPKAPNIIFTEKIKFEETGHESRVKMEMRGFGQFFVIKNGDQKSLPPPEEPKKNTNKSKQQKIEHPDSRTESVAKVFDDDEWDDLPF
jgi:twinkle protein